jgi:hypothetical protein
MFVLKLSGILIRFHRIVVPILFQNHEIKTQVQLQVCRIVLTNFIILLCSFIEGK